MADDEVRLGEPLAGNAVRRLIRDTGKVPQELRRRLRPEMRSLGQPLLADARSRASWSTRIPAALRLSTSFTMRHAGLSIVAKRSVAPHARAYEGITGNHTFRHPVFGDRDTWVEQETRPFLAPAVDLHARRVVDGVNRAVTDAAATAGFTSSRRS